MGYESSLFPVLAHPSAELCKSDGRGRCLACTQLTVSVGLHAIVVVSQTDKDSLRYCFIALTVPVGLRAIVVVTQTHKAHSGIASLP